MNSVEDKNSSDLMIKGGKSNSHWQTLPSIRARSAIVFVWWMLFDNDRDPRRHVIVERSKENVSLHLISRMTE